VKWLSLDTSPNFGALYQSAEKYDGARYEIRHYTEARPLGFGIVCARLYHRSVQIAEHTGVNALRQAQERAERHANPVPELDLPRCEVIL
jgi:hypothetical protein